MDLAGWGPPPPAYPAEIREARDEADLAAVADAMGAEGDLARGRIERGCRCFAAWTAAGVAGYGWLSPGREWIGEVGLEIAPPAGEAYVWNCVTLPGWRRRGVFRALVHELCRTAAAEGLRRLWIASLEGTAEAAVVDAAFQPVLHIDLDGVGARAVLAPDVGAAAADAGCRALGLRPGGVRPGPPRRH